MELVTPPSSLLPFIIPFSRPISLRPPLPSLLPSYFRKREMAEYISDKKVLTNTIFSRRDVPIRKEGNGRIALLLRCGTQFDNTNLLIITFMVDQSNSIFKSFFMSISLRKPHLPRHSAIYFMNIRACRAGFLCKCDKC